MSLKKFELRLLLAGAIVLGAFILAGCSPSIKYAYDAGSSLQGLKTYQWAAPGTIYRQDPLLETNVQFITDRDLAKKGLSRKADQADLIIWMNYEAEYSKGYQLRMLTLNIARADNRQMI